MRTRITVATISVAVVTGLAVAGGVALAEDNPRRGGTPVPSASSGVDDKGGLRNGSDDRPGDGPSASPSSRADDKGGLRGGHGADDSATHRANDDKGGLRGGHGADDSATHRANDDKGGLRGGHGADD
jgi:hypothetical protein